MQSASLSFTLPPSPPSMAQVIKVMTNRTVCDMIQIYAQTSQGGLNQETLT